MVTISMPLLDEDIDVWRPVQATHLSGDLFRVHGPVPEHERWAFAPGDVVHCAVRVFTDGQTALTAVAAEGPNDPPAPHAGG